MAMNTELDLIFSQIRRVEHPTDEQLLFALLSFEGDTDCGAGAKLVGMLVGLRVRSSLPYASWNRFFGYVFLEISE